MVREEIQVNPDLIAWARKRAGLTLEEASKKINRIAAWEAGDASPTYLQLERLADKLKLPVAVFFFPELPSLPPIRKSFRILPDAEFDMIQRRYPAISLKSQAPDFTRLGTHSNTRDHYGCEGETRKIVVRIAVISGCEASPVLELAEHSFDEISAFVGPAVQRIGRPA